MSISSIARFGLTHLAVAGAIASTTLRGCGPRPEIDEADDATISVQTPLGKCSGVLVAPNLALTAQHCLTRISQPDSAQNSGEQEFAPFKRLQEAKVILSEHGIIDTKRNSWSAVLRTFTNPLRSRFDGDDIAALLLSSQLKPEIIKTAAPRLNRPVIPGERFIGAGFGPDFEGEDPSRKRLRHGSVSSKVWAIPVNGSWLSEPETFFYHGDSGGPAYDSQGNVIGILSRPVQGASIYAHADLHYHADWIVEAALIAAKSGHYPAPTWATERRSREEDECLK